MALHLQSVVLLHDRSVHAGMGSGTGHIALLCALLPCVWSPCKAALMGATLQYHNHLLSIFLMQPSVQQTVTQWVPAPHPPSPCFLSVAASQVVETSGVADAEPLGASLAAAGFQLDAVVAVVDAEAGMAALEQPIAQAQVRGSQSRGGEGGGGG